MRNEVAGRQRFNSILADRPVLFRVALIAFSLLILFGAWQIVVSLELFSKLVLPSPGSVMSALTEFAGPILEALGVTLVEVLLGFGLAVTAGLLFAIAISYSKLLNAVLYPWLLLLNATPKVAIAPVLLIWLGFGLAPKVAVGFLIAFFPVLIAAATGLQGVDDELHELARSFHASRWRRFVKIDFPHSLPSFFAGLKVAITLSVTGALLGELLSADQGLGFLLVSAVQQQLTALAFAIVMVIATTSMLLFGAVVALEWLLMPWTRRTRR
jgi:NitT/TauT family transport system permease protein